VLKSEILKFHFSLGERKEFLIVVNTLTRVGRLLNDRRRYWSRLLQLKAWIVEDLVADSASTHSLLLCFLLFYRFGDGPFMVVACLNT